MKRNNFIEGIKFSLGIIFILTIFGTIYAVGFHNANEILSGNFLGNYVFKGNVTFEKQIIEENWIQATLQSGWINFETGYYNASYIKDSQGFVHLRGVVRSGTIGGTSCIFTLPVDYRSNYNAMYSVESNDSHGRLQINENGCVSLRFGSNLWVALDGIYFKID